MDDQLPDAGIHTVSDLLSGFSLKKLQAVEPELEDSFVALLRQRKLAEQDSVSNDHTSLSVDSLSDATIAIEAQGLTRDFDGFRAVDQASFCVRQGEIFGLLGANGAGKTTVIKMLTGILQPTEGEGHTAGADMRRAAQTIKERIGYTSQSFSLYQDMTVMENIRLYARIYGVRRHELNQRIKQVVELAGLQGLEGRLAGKLPMGIRQRLALGCSLVHRPRILFLDEPTSGVDPIGRRRFWDILVHLSRVEQVAILITTHYMSEAEHCDHLALMHAGRIIADDSPEAMKQDLQEDAGELLEITVDQPLVVLELLEQTGFEGVALFGKRIHLLAKDTKKAETQIRALLTSRSLQLLNIKPHTLTLEDVFVYRIMALEKQERQL
jgi:ABC-2 type transport system ATP-binding protein